MADLKLGSQIGGNLIWHAGVLPLKPSDTALHYKQFDVITSKGGQTVNGDITFTGLSIAARYQGSGSNVTWGTNGNGAFGVVRADDSQAEWVLTSKPTTTGTIRAGIQIQNTTTGGIRIYTNSLGHYYAFSSGQISVSGSTPTATSHLTRKDYVDAQVQQTLDYVDTANTAQDTRLTALEAADKTFVNLTGAQTISGVKTFTALPTTSVVPTASGHVVNKAYADTKVSAVSGTGAISVTTGTTPVVSIAAATQTVPGTMSAADKTKLDGIPANAVSASAAVFTGNVTLGTNFLLGMNSSVLLRDFNNGNVVLCGSKNASGTAGQLYIGYNNGTNYTTSQVRLETYMTWKATHTLVDANGLLNSDKMYGDRYTLYGATGTEGTITGTKLTVNAPMTVTGDIALNGTIYSDRGTNTEPQVGVKRSGRSLYLYDNNSVRGLYAAGITGITNYALISQTISSGQLNLGHGSYNLAISGPITTNRFYNVSDAASSQVNIDAGSTGNYDAGIRLRKNTVMRWYIWKDSTAEDGTNAGSNLRIRGYNDDGSTHPGDAVTINRASRLVTLGGALTVAGTVTAPTFVGALTGNATTATTLQTARNINGTSFNGSANITTANWGTARTLTIGASGKSVNGSGDISWSHNDMQVPKSLTLNFGGTNTGITTDEFIALLTSYGAFDQRYWVARGGWSYAGNNYITDTGLGIIHLAGTTVEVFSGTGTQYTIKISTPTTTVSGGTVQGDFVYTNNGSGYGPAWRRLYSTAYKPTAADVGAVSKAGDTVTGTLNTAHISAWGTGNDYNNGGVELYGNGSANTVYPTLGFHQPNLYASSIQLRAAGDFRFYAQGTGSYASITANNGVFTGSVSIGGINAVTQAVLNALFPVGHMLLSYNAANPSTYGYPGTWALTEDGAVLMAVTSSPNSTAQNTMTKSVPVTAHTHTYSGTSSTVSNDHTHGFSATTSSDGYHSHSYQTSRPPDNSGRQSAYIGYGQANSQSDQSGYIYGAGAHTHTVSGTTGGISANHTHTYSGTTASTGTANATMDVTPRHVRVYAWVRTA